MQFDFDPNDHRCRHLRINGARCTTAALAGETLCFEHKYRKLRTGRGRKPRLPDTFNVIPLVSFAWVEDHASVLYNLNSIMEAFSHGTIDHRQAIASTCIQRAALKTLRQSRDLDDFAHKEKPAQRFELDECDLPVALDEPQPTAEPVATPTPVPVPASAPACTLNAEPSALPPASADGTLHTESSTLPPAPADDCSRTAEPGTFLPARRTLTGIPIGVSFEDRIREYYNNNPEFLLPMGIQPHPIEPAAHHPQMSAADATPQPVPCTLNTEPCTLDAFPRTLNAEPCALNSVPEPGNLTLVTAAADTTFPVPCSLRPITFTDSTLTTFTPLTPFLPTLTKPPICNPFPFPHLPKMKEKIPTPLTGPLNAVP